MMFCSFFLPSSFIYAISSPVRNMGEMYPLSLVDEGSALAGIKGFEYEYGYLPTSDWIGLVSDLGDGNFIVRADIINIMGTGLNLQLGMTYNSYNSTVDIGAGKGWMTDLHQVVSEDGTTHDVTFVTATGAKLLFEYDSGNYISPLGFSGTLTKKIDGTYEIKTLGKEKLTFNTSGKLTKVERCGGGSYNVGYDGNGRPITITDPMSSRSVTLTWDQGGRLTDVTDSMSQNWEFNYSESGGKLISIEKPDSSVSEFSYDDNLNYKMIGHSDFLSNDYVISYYTSGGNTGKLESITDPAENETTFNYETNVGGYDKRTSVTDAESRVTYCYFGDSTHLEKVSAVSGNDEIKTVIEYDETLGLNCRLL